jgi:adenosylhomocysteine nucleosidase
LKKTVIIAALERELRPLVKQWPATTVRHEGREFTFYESDYAIAVCSGIGPEAARAAAEAIIAQHSPDLLISAGVAGSLVPELHVGETIFPTTVIDTQDGSRHETAIHDAPLGKTPLARTVLASYPEIAGAAQKQQLTKSYGAHAVDMEAAAVARAAQVHGLPFLAIKAISDELDFELPDMSRFIRGGQFQTARFLLYVAIRPWLWLRVFRLARNTRIASENLCAWLRESVLTNTIVPGILPKHNS